MEILKLLVLLICITLSACATAQQKRQQVISQGVYAVQASIQAGRFDLAKKYSDQLTKIVPAPKKKTEIATIKENGPASVGGIKKSPTVQNYVVLPQEFTGYQSLVENSEQLNKIIADNAALKKVAEKEKQDLELYNQKVGESMNATITASEEEKSSIWGWVLGAVGGLGVVGAIAAVACFPALLPLATNILSSVAGIINQFISALSSLFQKK